MTNSRSPANKRRPAQAPAKAAELLQPDWALGLKSIYDAVVDEPLPDDMLQLLASLDAEAAESGH